MKIGIYGGTFNPPHNGHIILAENFIKEINLDKLLIIPAGIPPHKAAKNLPDGKDRAEMCRIAFGNIPKTEISNIELNRSGKSYTVDTLTEIKKTYPESEIFLLVGTDMLLSFKRWYRWEDILSMAVLCCGDRDEIDLRKNADEDLLEKVILLKGEKFSVSSTFIRELISKKENISHLVPKEIEKYITEKGLYNA